MKEWLDERVREKIENNSDFKSGVYNFLSIELLLSIYL